MDEFMNINEVKDLIREVLQSDISEFELEHTGTRIKLKRGIGQDSTLISLSQPSAKASAAPFAASRSESFSQAAEGAENTEEAGLHIITSPIVGTFFRSSSPEAEPYVQLGDIVKEGSILCLVEAMKLMNEIPSDIEGEIKHIYVENGAPVEFGQKLFSIRPGKQG
jgi:acetyl-CoA carboxylase biotin carboxyl carrier protein